VKTKDKTTSFDRIMRGLGEAAEIAEGRAAPARLYAPKDIDVKAVRKRMGLSQEAFSVRFGFPLGTLRDWEQRISKPTAAARVLLTVIDREPEAVARALNEAAA